MRLYNRKKMLLHYRSILLTFFTIIVFIALSPTAEVVEASTKDDSKFFPATDPAIRYVGRVVKEQEKVVFDWPCVTIETTFMAASVAITVDGGNNAFAIFLDGKELPRLQTTDSTKVTLIIN